jgi:beta-glucosidase
MTFTPDAEAAIDAKLAQLDLETKVTILTGQDFWSLPAAPAIGLQSIVVSDGPVGVRGTNWTAADPSIAMPSPTALAATWDVELARTVGRVLGQESRRKGVHVLLAPTVNLHRTPLGGRHFEAYSEDPLLTGAIGSAYVQGVQEHSVGVTVKHYVANDAETERFTVDNQVGERALRELYLAPFETIIGAGAWGVMSAYNGVNGASMTEHGPLQNGVLKGEWGFDGIVMSDWLAATDCDATAIGGLDIVMPAMNSPWGGKLVEAVRAGRVDERLIDDKVRRLLRLAARVGALDGIAPAVAAEDRPEIADGRAVAREVAARSFVLAKNDGALPIANDSGVTRIALLGALAKHARVLGGGSATVFPDRIISPLDGLAAALPDGVELIYATGADPRTKLAPIATEVTAVLRNNDGSVAHETVLPEAQIKWMSAPDGVDTESLAEVELRATITAEVGGTHQVAIRGIGMFTLVIGGETVFNDFVAPENADLSLVFLSPPETRFPVELAAGQSIDVQVTQHGLVTEPTLMVSLTLAHGEPQATPEEMLDEAVRAAEAADIAIVVVGTTNEVESEGFDRTTLALPGLQDELVRRVSAVNHRTVAVVNAGSPVELPWADDVAAILLTWFPGQEAGHALADVVLGAVEPGGRMPTTWPVRMTDCPVLNTTPDDGRLAYTEGVFIGYRAWDRGAPAPRFAFGSGMGYTTWAYDDLKVADSDVTVTVRNTGERAGREVVQVYAGPSAPDADRPLRWLVGFAVVAAGPGETATAHLTIPERAFQTWQDGWHTVPGDYTISAGHSISDLPLSATVIR